MADRVNPADIFTNASFLDADERKELAQNGTPFDIVGISYEPNDEYGPRWLLHVVFDEDDENPRILSLADNDARNRQLSRAKESLAPGRKIGPVMLASRETQSGQMAYSIEPVHETAS